MSAAEAPSRPARRVGVRLSGTVQGVGFRPYVYRLARELDLSGFVLNDSRGVLLEVDGAAAAVAEFLARLPSEKPPLAQIERLVTEELESTGRAGFTIRESVHQGLPDAPVTPDAATCAACLAELFDPDDRRYRYPFTNCTNCGPRFTIIRGVPYDRPLTTMAAFVMCEQCRREYEDPGDRRFHAQPNACPVCGPSVSLLDSGGSPAAFVDSCDAVQAAAWALRDGRIVAVKGIGGFHLACRADDELAVAALRGRKHREDKPFALMAGSLAEASRLVSAGQLERALLVGPERPIVLAERRRDAAVAPSVAPHSRELGVMLPYSPLHHLLLSDCATPLVMTSGNLSDEPIAYHDDDARERLGVIADLFLVHDRPIETRTDDSVMRVVRTAQREHATILRRSRGHVPSALKLPGATPVPLLACGAELKSTFCVAKGERAWVSHHVGDLRNWETYSSFVEGIAHFERLFAVRPQALAHDMHPEYLSTKYALEREDVELVAVQHHHAHLAACLAEHDESGPAIGAIFDGTGYGSDGTVWGGELLFGDLAGFERAGTLSAVRLPGGDQAVREPWRMACAWLVEARGDEPEIPSSLCDRVGAREWRQVGQLARSGFASPLTSSMGRLFDAVGALCGLAPVANYEGQAAVELEALCDPRSRDAYPLELTSGPEGMLVLDARDTVLAVSEDLRRGAAVAQVASRFHGAVAAATVEGCARAASARGVDLVVLSGGVFQNRRLLEAVSGGLGARGLRVLTPALLPSGDGGIAFGQAAVAARQLELAGR